jgi:hypothetical protein
MMKNVAFFATMFLLCHQAIGQDVQNVSFLANDILNSNSFSNFTVAHLNEVRPRGLRQRNIGRALTIGGVAMGFAGVLVFTDARKGRVIANGQVTQEPETDKMLAGLYLIEGGLGMVIPGIILWKKGQKKYNRYLEELSVSFHSTGNAFAIRYRF